VEATLGRGVAIVPLAILDEGAREREVALVFEQQRAEPTGEKGDEDARTFSLPCFECGGETRVPGWMVIGNVVFLARNTVDERFDIERSMACNQICAECADAERLRALLASADSSCQPAPCSICGATPEAARGWVIATDEIHLLGPGDDINVGATRRIGSWCKPCFARHDVESKPPEDWPLR
jgi:hypothetical protein